MNRQWVQWRLEIGQTLATAKECLLVAVISIFAMLGLCQVGFGQTSAANNSAKTESLQDLAKDFWGWRARYQPFTTDDIPRIERPYQIGKMQILEFLADARIKQGKQFNLRAFHDYLWKNGNVPQVLQRWEYLGDDSQLRVIEAKH
jgi:hypothetical protein